MPACVAARCVSVTFSGKCRNAGRLAHSLKTLAFSRVRGHVLRPMRLLRVLQFALAVFLLPLAGLSASARAATVGDWKLIKHDGRDHVTLENVGRFYGLGGLQRVSSKGVSLGGHLYNLRGAVGSNELHINSLKFILSYPIAEVNGQPIVSRMDLAKVIEPVLRPSRIKGAENVSTIILDAGHGGHDKGAVSLWGNEKTYTLDVALRAKSLLEMQGLKVYLTRSSDSFIPLDDRVRFANQFENALFISIHFNSGGTGSGLETYTLAPRGVPSMMADGPSVSDLQPCRGNVRDAENMALACATHAALVSHSQLYDRGIKRARFVVIRDIKIPGVLIEGGFLSHPHDSRKVATTEYRQNMAMCIATAVQNYRQAVGSPGLLMANKSPAGDGGGAGMTIGGVRGLDENADHPAQNKPHAVPIVITPTARN